MVEHSREDLFRYLRGDLSQSERASVKKHLSTCAKCSDFLAFVRNLNATLKEMAEGELRPDTPCPDPEVLAAFEAKELDEKTAQQLRHHTVFCKDCLEELYLLRQVARDSGAFQAEDEDAALKPPSGLKHAAKVKLSVCILLPEPQVVSEFEHLLAQHQCNVFVKHVKSVQEVGPDDLELPPAQVYILGVRGQWPTAGRLLANILEKYPAVRLIVVAEALGGFDISLFRMGVKGLLTHVEARRKLIHAIQLVAAGGSWVPKSLASKALDSILAGQKGNLSHREQKQENLSNREREVLGLLLENLSDKEVASKLNIAERTVRLHVSHLVGKFGVHDRAELILMPFQRPATPS